MPPVFMGFIETRFSISIFVHLSDLWRRKTEFFFRTIPIRILIFIKCMVTSFFLWFCFVIQLWTCLYSHGKFPTKIQFNCYDIYAIWFFELVKTSIALRNMPRVHAQARIRKTHCKHSSAWENHSMNYMWIAGPIGWCDLFPSSFLLLFVANQREKVFFPGQFIS